MMRQLTFFCVLAGLLAMQPGALAQEDAARQAQVDAARQAQVDAATASAVERLQADISANLITRNLTVDDLLRRTGGSDDFRKVLQRSRQIGGPRWIDDQTCQVQLEVSGETVAQALINIASADPARSPLPPDVLARELRAWKGRSFVATGTSATPERVQKLRPGGAWVGIPEEARCQALAAARQDAMRRSLDSVRVIELSPGRTVGDALSRPEVAERMNRWFEKRPVKGVTYNDDLEIDLVLSAPADEAFDAFVESARVVQDAGLPQEEAELSRLRAQFVQRMGRPAGRGRVPPPGVELIERFKPPDLPAHPPRWVNQQLDADGEAKPDKNRLHATHAAQERAMQNLRAKVGALPLSDGRTLDQAANDDARIKDAIDRAMVRARVFKVDYDSDGGVRVRVGLEARIIWDEILNAR